MMKHLMKRLLSVSLLVALLLPVTACNQGATHSPADTTGITEAADTEGDSNTVENTNEGLAEQEQWLAHELTFISDKIYADPLFETQLDVVFTHDESGDSFTMPAFWDGGTTWRVRYALTSSGKWSWTTVCTDETNAGLHGRTGEMLCVAYTGQLDVYKHGFLKTESGVRYFMYDDGTPFFYLGDTHFSLPLESIDGINPEGCADFIKISQATADEYGITSMFKYIMDYRADQGYTVIQSQQLGYYVGVSGNSWMGDAEGTIFTHGVNDMILSKFKELDRYFAYIAEKGFVHAHTQFSYPEELIEIYLAGGITAEQIDTYCRYWVARYAAYPVMWVTAQEGDADHYGYNGCTPETNPWPIVMESIAKYDPYDHPSSCHMENSYATEYEDFFFDELDSHTWYATQFGTTITNGPNWELMEELWSNANNKPLVNYEAAYDHFWCNTYKARTQIWMAFLNGHVGHGYGSQPIWQIFWAGNEPDSVNSDEIGEFSIELTWLEGLYADAGQQMAYMKDFIDDYEWWRLTPNFEFTRDTYLTKVSDKYYSAANIGSELYIAYFYGSESRKSSLGTFQHMENAHYEIVWMNCATGERTPPEIITVTDGTYRIPKKPTDDDWVIAARLIQE